MKKKVTGEAIKPDVFMSFSDIGEDEKPKKNLSETEEKDPDDIALESLESTKGWMVLREYIEHLKSEMDALVASLIAEGGSFEDIGKITVVSNLAKEKLDDIIKRVQDAKDAVSG